MAIKNFTMKANNGAGWDTLYPKTNIAQVDGLQTSLDTIDAIAKGASKAKVFDSVSQLDTWLAVQANKDSLKVGDNLLIRAKDTPDYWWDGSDKQELESTKITIELATASNNGLLSKSDFTKLAGIATGATRVTTPSDIGAAPSTHNHTKSQITDFPTSLPASDVSAWAKADSKPTYTAAEVGAATADQGAKADTALQAVPYEDTASNIKMNATASAGSSAKAARADHIHPVDTSREAAFTKNTAFNKNFETTASAFKAPGTAAVGSSSNIPRADHVHPAQTSVSGNAGSADKLSSSKTFQLTGDVTGSVSSDLSGNVSIAATQVANKSNQKVAVSKNSTSATGTRKQINFKDGTNVTVTVTDNATNDAVDVTIASVNTTYNAATTSAAGLMSAADKTKAGYARNPTSRIFVFFFALLNP